MSTIKMTALADLVGGAEPMNPAAMQFRARLADPGRKDCSGCLFRGQRSIVCQMAGQVAQRAGGPDCDERDADTGRTFVYVPAVLDARQIDFINAGDPHV